MPRIGRKSTRGTLRRAASLGTSVRVSRCCCGKLAVTFKSKPRKYCSNKCQWGAERRRNYDPALEAQKNLRARARAAGLSVNDYIVRVAEQHAKIVAIRARKQESKPDYPGGCCFPSKRGAQEAGIICRTCGRATPRSGSRYCSACSAYHTLKSKEAEKRKRLGYYMRRGWRDVQPSGPKKRDKDKEAQRVAMFGCRCAWCGDELEGDVTMDHVIPESSGGTNWPSNLVPACRACNSSKSSRHPAEFVRWRMRKALNVTRFAVAIANHYARMDPVRRGVPDNRRCARNRVRSAP